MIAIIPLGLFDAIFFVGPLAEIDQFATFAAERPVAIGTVPRVFLSALWTGNDDLFPGGHYSEQKVRSKGMS